MKYGVVICNKCRNAKAVELKYKTTKCSRCNKIINIKENIIIFKSSNPQLIVEKIGKINREIN